MNRYPFRLIFPLLVLLSIGTQAQPDEDQIGAWYMFFWTYDFKESRFGIQGDLQHRNWDIAGDMEQVVFRNGLTYRPGSGDIKFTLGYAHIENGAFGKQQSLNAENRIYQEALIPQKIGGRFFLTHRFRFEQRKLHEQHLRTRYRQFLGINIPINQSDLKKNALYIALYNELFINGQRQVGAGKEVELFDRNRLYCGMGFSIHDQSRVQLGFMRQSTDLWSKNQLQIGLHQWF